MKFTCTAIALCVATSALAEPTKTTPFSIPLKGTTLAKRPDLAGTVIKDGFVPFKVYSPKPDIHLGYGKVQVRVSRAKDNTLEFAWRIVVDPNSQITPVTCLYVSGFPLAVYDADWRIDGLGTAAPVSISYAGPGKPAQGGAGMTFKFDFGKSIGAGNSSRFFFIKTKMTKWKEAAAFVGGLSYQGESFASAAPTN